EDILADESVLEARAQRCAEQEIVDTPADVSFTGASHRAPPGIMAAAALELAERVHKTRVQQGAESSALFGREAMVLHVGSRISQIDGGVRHVEVAAENHRLPSPEPLQVAEEIPVPLLPIGQTRQFPFGVRHVDIDQEEVAKFSRQYAPFLVVLSHS